MKEVKKSLVGKKPAKQIHKIIEGKKGLQHESEI